MTHDSWWASEKLDIAWNVTQLLTIISLHISTLSFTLINYKNKPTPQARHSKPNPSHKTKKSFRLESLFNIYIFSSSLNLLFLSTPIYLSINPISQPHHFIIQPRHRFLFIIMHSILIFFISSLLVLGQEESQISQSLDPSARQLASASSGEPTGNQTASLTSTNNFVSLDDDDQKKKLLALVEGTYSIKPTDILSIFFIYLLYSNYRLTFVFLRKLWELNWWTVLNSSITTPVTQLLWAWYEFESLWFPFSLFSWTSPTSSSSWIKKN